MCAREQRERERERTERERANVGQTVNGQKVKAARSAAFRRGSGVEGVAVARGQRQQQNGASDCGEVLEKGSANRGIKIRMRR